MLSFLNTTGVLVTVAFNSMFAVCDDFFWNYRLINYQWKRSYGLFNLRLQVYRQVQNLVRPQVTLHTLLLLFAQLLLLAAYKYSLCYAITYIVPVYAHLLLYVEWVG